MVSRPVFAMSRSRLVNFIGTSRLGLVSVPDMKVSFTVNVMLSFVHATLSWSICVALYTSVRQRRAPVFDVFSPLPARSSFSSGSLHHSCHHAFYFPAVVHSTNVSEQSQFSPHDWLHDVKLSVKFNLLRTPTFRYSHHPTHVQYSSVAVSVFFIVQVSPACNAVLHMPVFSILSFAWYRNVFLFQNDSVETCKQ